MWEGTNNLLVFSRKLFYNSEIHPENRMFLGIENYFNIFKKSIQ